jgi:hypothetical protein
MSAESHHITQATPLSSTNDASGADTVGRWIAQLEEQVRKSPSESILIAFLIGGLLQVFAVRSLLLNLVRLVLWLATPILFGFAAWRLYQSLEGSGNLRRSPFTEKRKAAE